MRELTRLSTTSGEFRSAALPTFNCWDRVGWHHTLQLVTPAALALVSVAVLALLAACVVTVLFDAVREGGRHSSESFPGRSPRHLAVVTAVLFFAVCSAKLVLIQHNPVTAPFWDQWDGEARVLYQPFGACSLAWAQMFSLHNEHRFFFSRVLALDLLIANGQWDPRLQQVVNAALHSCVAILLVAILWIAQERRRLCLVVVVVAATFVLPFAWENTLLGFQSGFYFLLLFSILGLWLTTRYSAPTGPWILGWLCSLCALFTGASGVLLPVAIVGVVVLTAGDRRDWRDSRFTFGAAGVILILGLLTASPPLAYHEPLRAKTVADFAGAFGRNMAWPFVAHPQASFAMWLPTAVLLAAAAAQRARTTVAERFIIGLTLWVALQAAAIAYGRGAGAPVPAARYQDFLSLGLIANVIAAVLCVDRLGDAPTARRVAMTALATWFLVAGVGLYQLTSETRSALAGWRQRWVAQAASVRRFVVAGDLAEFISKRPVEELPYPDARPVASMLREPYFRRILPAAVREPVRVEQRPAIADGFVPLTSRDVMSRAWTSYTDRGALAMARFESGAIGPCQSGVYLQFDVDGHLGTGNSYLAVTTLQSGRTQRVTLPDAWREGPVRVRVSCPAGPYAIIAVDASPDGWFSFQEPVEIGRLSAMSERLIASSSSLLVGALIVGLLATCGYGQRGFWRTVREPGPGFGPNQS